MHVAVVIPARYAATRLPGKPLVELAGRPLIQWPYECARQAGSVAEVLVATDHPDIVRAVEAFGGRAVLTDSSLPSGSDRVAEAVRCGAVSPAAEVVINLQGDEPLLDTADLDALAAAFVQEPDLQVATLSRPLREEDLLTNPNVVKVVTDLAGFALYFSRAPIPFPRNRCAALKHVGIYAYRRDALLAFAGAEPTPLERAESLEQLRILERGGRIRVVPARSETVGVDTPDDLARVRAILAARSNRP